MAILRGTSGKPVLDLRGQTFGRLKPTSLELLPTRSKWRCQCECGKEILVPASQLTSGKTKSCGCLRREMGAAKNLRHGLSYSSEHAIWCNIKQRCSGEDNANYGGRGIRVCDRWDQSFEAFLADVGPRPSPHHSIDRIDNNGDYEPGNVRWADGRTQGANKRNNKLVTYRGETLIAAEWDRRCGFAHGTVNCRVFVLGWDVERALTTPMRNNKRRAEAAISQKLEEVE